MIKGNKNASNSCLEQQLNGFVLLMKNKTPLVVLSGGILQYSRKGKMIKVKAIGLNAVESN